MGHTGKDLLGVQNGILATRGDVKSENPWQQPRKCHLRDPCLSVYIARYKSAQSKINRKLINE